MDNAASSSTTPQGAAAAAAAAPVTQQAAHAPPTLLQATLASLSDLLCDAVASCLPPIERLALCATSKVMEARFVVTMDFLPLGPRRAFSYGENEDIDNDKMHRRLGTSVPPPSYLLGGLLARVGRFVGRIYLRCTEVSINDGIYGVLLGAYRGKVKMICTDS